MRRFLFAATLLLPLSGHAQFDALSPRTDTPNLLATPTLTPGEHTLYDLEARFAADVAQRGGSAFASWFADDAVVLSNGKAALLGRTAITAASTWNPNVYHLTWKPDGARMGPSVDSGFTWGHFEGTSRDQNGQPVITAGRYITVWKKVGGDWKVSLDAGANEPPGAGDCCALPKP